MPAKSHILIVDDDPDIRRVLSLLLSPSYQVDEAPDGPAAVAYMSAQPNTDLVILDIMMPGMSGFETCQQIRKHSNAPILFLTAKSAEDDRLSAYGSGGDDFLPKPFSHAELLAKVGSLLRRYQEYRGKPGEVVAIEGLEIDLDSHKVKNNGEEVILTEKEYAILEYLLRQRGSTVTTRELYEAVWKDKYLPGSNNTVMVHVLNLRKKVEAAPSNPTIVRTVWGRGYQID